jgi:hypothetical protein
MDGIRPHRKNSIIAVFAGEPWDMSFSVSHLAEARAILDRLDTDVIERMALLLAELRDRKGRLFFLGVGGSAGNCGHAVNVVRRRSAHFGSRPMLHKPSADEII